MRPSLPRIAGRVLLFGGIALAGIYGVQSVVQIVRVDPFARMRAGQNDQAQKIGVQLTNVSMIHYRGSKLMSRAQVERIDVMQDRQTFLLHTIRNGRYYGEEGEVQFQAATGKWNAQSKSLEVTSGARVSAKEFDLKASGLTFNDFRNQLEVRGQVQGRLYEGQVKSDGFRFNTKSRVWSVGPFQWEGPLALAQEGQPAPAQREQWRLTGESSTGDERKVVWLKGTATNGETIVKADRVEQDRETRVITAIGRVSYFSAKANMTCQKAVIYTRERRAVLTGGVDMLIKPQDAQAKVEVVEIPPFRPVVPDEVSKARPQAPNLAMSREESDELRSGESARRYPIAVTAEKVEYWYRRGERRAVITGNPQAFQELPNGRWRRVWTNQGLYDGEKETLRLVSSQGKKDTRIKNSLGDDLVATWVQISTREGDDSWNAFAPEGVVFPDDEDLPPAGGGTGGGTGGGGGTPPLQGPIGGLRARR